MRKNVAAIYRELRPQAFGEWLQEREDSRDRARGSRERSQERAQNRSTLKNRDMNAAINHLPMRNEHCKTSDGGLSANAPPLICKQDRGNLRRHPPIDVVGPARVQ